VNCPFNRELRKQIVEREANVAAGWVFRRDKLVQL